MSFSRYQRNAWGTAAVLFLLAPLLLPGAVWRLQSMYTSPSDWAPPSHPERQEYEWFIRAFEREDAIVVAWPDCTVDDPRLEKLEYSLNHLIEQQRAETITPLFERVITGRSLLERLTNRPIDLASDDAAARLRGVVIGDDGRASCAVVVLTGEGARRRQSAIEIVRREASQAANMQEDDLHLAGDSVVAATIDQESLQTLYNFSIPSAAVSLLLCWWRLRSWRYTLAVIAAAAFGGAASLSVLYCTGINMNAILIVMPPLIFVQVVSSGVHLVNYYLDEVRLHGADGAPQRAMAIGWTPCWMCTITTAIGMASLVVSEIEPIRVFGILSALGLVTTVGILFLLLPGVLERWPFHSPYEKSSSAPGSAAAKQDESPETADELSPLTHHFQRWERFADYVTHHGRLLLTVSLLAMAIAGIGLTRITTSVNVQALFERDSRILRDVDWLEAWIGPLTPVEAVVRFEPDCRLTNLERLQLVQELHRAIEELEIVGGVMSPLTFAPPNLDRPPGGAFAGTRHRAALRAAVRRFEEANFLAANDGEQSWRISARVRVDDQTDYEDYLRQFRAAAEPALRRVREEQNATGVDLLLTGVVPLSDQVHKILLADLHRSFLTAFGLVAVAMIATLRGLAPGLLAMLPNVFPAVLVFGLLGWAGVPLDIGTIMTASIALGIAVDDTLHFLTWYRRETWDGAGREDAIRKTFRHCGRAMVQSSLITGLGLLVFSLSGFLPTKRFAWMITCLLLAALAGDLLFLPALLMSQIGRFFLRRKPTLPASP